jgi:broad specificity phosphatase PhoE
MIRFFLVRHGETKSNKEGRFRGRIDVPLNENGIQQAKSLSQILENESFNAIYSSPLSRALETAKIIAGDRGIPIIVDERIHNISLGSWEGKLKSEIREKFPNLYHLWLTNPEKLSFKGMEPLKNVQKRSVQFVQDLIREWSHLKEATICLVTHRAVLKPLIAGLLEIKSPYFWKIHMDTAAYSIIDYEKDRGFTLYQLNQTIHLREITIERE